MRSEQLIDVFSSAELAKAGAADTEIVPSNGIAYGKDKIYCYFDSMEVYAKGEEGIEFVCKLPDIPSDAFSKGVIDTESRTLLKDTVTYIVANDRKRTSDGRYQAIADEGQNGFTAAKAATFLDTVYTPVFAAAE